MAQKTFTEKDMEHELNTRLKAKGIDINIKDTGIALDTFEKIVQEQLVAGNTVKMQNFGTFEVRDEKARNRYNPSTKKTELYPATKRPKWDASDALRTAVAEA
jgi:DNA-binding protein HU-beta